MLPPGPGPALPALGGGVAQRIAVTEQLVAQDPKNLQAWIQLGNDYFDTHQAQKSIDAYARALALDPNNADVITDQGVMYREIGQFDKALANFEKASKLNPRHQMSLYNAGVVLAFDKKDAKKATEAWNRVIAIDPASPTAAQARSQIQAMSGRPPGP
jgi:cytochrome c-type biogenesis protein CcmH/NrfG